MVMATIPYKSPLTLLCDITLDYLLYLFVGSCLKTPQVRREPQALLSTDTSAQPIQILQWFRYSLANRGDRGGSSLSLGG